MRIVKLGCYFRAYSWEYLLAIRLVKVDLIKADPRKLDLKDCADT